MCLSTQSIKIPSIHVVNKVDLPNLLSPPIGEIFIDTDTHRTYISDGNQLVEIKETKTYPYSLKQMRCLNDVLTYEECLLNIVDIDIDLLKRNTNICFTELQFKELEMLQKIVPIEEDATDSVLVGGYTIL